MLSVTHLKEQLSTGVFSSFSLKPSLQFVSSSLSYLSFRSLQQNLLDSVTATRDRWVSYQEDTLTRGFSSTTSELTLIFQKEKMKKTLLV